MPSEWYETFFTPLALDFWRSAVPAAATVAEADFLARTLELSPPARLLDLPCGLGRHALELSRRGYAVTGIDLSDAAIAAARAEAAAQQLGARFLRGDMRAPVPDGPFDGAYCFGNSFGYLQHAEMGAFVRRMLEAVRPGGRWVIDTGAAAESLLPQLTPERTLEAGGISYRVRSRYDAVAGRLRQSCTLVRGGERQEAEIDQGVSTVAELCRLLQDAGWEVSGVWGGLDCKPFELGDRRLLIAARRPW